MRQITLTLFRALDDCIDVLFVACVIDSPSNFAYYLGLSNFFFERGLLYFRVLYICLLLVCFVGSVKHSLSL